MLKLSLRGLDFVLEAPCAARRETAYLRRHCRTPIILDAVMQPEADVATMIAEDLAYGIGLKISVAGGLTKARRQCDICRSAGLTMSVRDTVGSTLAFATIVRLVATVPTSLLRCILNCEDMLKMRTAAFNHGGSKGSVLAPEAPGLGAHVNEDILGEPMGVYAGPHAR